MELDNVKKWIVVAGGAFIVALAAALWYLRSDEEMPAQNPAPETARARDKGTAKRGRLSNPAKDKSQEKAEEDEEGQDDSGEQEDESTPDEESETEEEPAEEAMTEGEQAAENFWEDLQEGKKWREPYESGVPMEEVEKFRRQFNKIPPEERGDYLDHALNLVPDENIMLLAGILLDKSQPEEYLELVYNDILNRDESMKKTLLREIYKDKEHPCWETTAWILDATGETP